MPTEEALITEVSSPEKIRNSLMENLKKYYQAQDKITRIFGETFSVSQSYINLLIIEDKDKSDEKKEKQFGSLENEGGEEKSENKKGVTKEHKELLHADDIIYGIKKSIEINKLFIDENGSVNKSPKKQVIFGGAGSGKTTLLRYIVTQHVEGKLWNDKFDYVILIPLRRLLQLVKTHEENNKEKKKKLTLKKIIKSCCCDPNGDEIDATDKEIKKFFKQDIYKNKTLFLLDGFDEVASFAMNENDPENAIFATLLSQLLSYPYVLLTSRPCPIVVKNNFIAFDRRLENIGFTDKNIQAFSNTILSQEKAALFISFLKKNPKFLQLARVPINLELIAKIWEKEIFGNNSDDNLNINSNSNLNNNQNNSNNTNYLKSNNTRTMTYLYARITHYLFYRFLLERKKISHNDLNDSTIFNANIQAIKIALEKLAFYGMQNKTAMISGKKFKEIIKQIKEQFKEQYPKETTLSDDVLNCGLLRFIGMSPLIEGNDYYFIHLTFQEFFTASEMQQCFYRPQLTPPSSMQFIQSNQPIQLNQQLQLFREHKYDEYYEITWAFTAGLLYQHYQSKQDALPLLRFWDAFLSEPRDVIGLRETVLTIRCLEECAADENISIHKKLLTNVAKWFECLVEEEFIVKNCEKNKEESKNAENGSFSYSTRYLSITKTEILPLCDYNNDWSIERAKNQSFGYFMRYLSASPNVHCSKNLGAVYANKNKVGKILEKLSDLLHCIYYKYRAIDALDKIARAGIKLQEGTIRTIIKLLKSRDKYDRRETVRALSGFAKAGLELPEETVTTVIELLGEYDTHVDIVFALGDFAEAGIISKANIAAAVKLLKDDDGFVRRNAVHALGKFVKAGIKLPEEAISAVIELLKDIYAYVRSDAVDALGRFAKAGIKLSEKVITTVIKLLKDSNVYVRHSAIITLGEFIKAGIKLSEEAILAVIKLLKDLHECVMNSAIHALGELVKAGIKLPKKTTTTVIKLLEDGDEFVSRNAVRALGEFAKAGIKLPEEAITTVIKLLKDDCVFVRCNAVHALGEFIKAGIKLPEEAITTVIELLKDSDEFVSRNAVSTLGKFAKIGIKLPEETIATVIELLKDSDEFVSRNAMNALGEFAEAGIISETNTKATIELLKDSKKSVRDHTVSTLGSFATAGIKIPEKAISAVIELLKDRYQYVRCSAVSTLGKFVKAGIKLPENTIEKLFALLKDEGDEGLDVRQLARTALVPILQRLFSECTKKDSSLLTTSVLKNISQFSLYYPLLLTFNPITKNICFQLERKRYEISVPEQEWEKTQKEILEIFYNQAKKNQLPLDYYETQFKFGLGFSSISSSFSSVTANLTSIKTQLHIAAEKGEVEEVKKILNQGVIDINDQNNPEQLTPIMCAINNQRWQIVDFFLEKWSDLNCTNKIGFNVFNLLLQIAPDNLDLLIKCMRKRSRLSVDYLRQCLEECSKATDHNKALDIIVSRLIGKDIGKMIKELHTIYYAHVQSLKGVVQQESAKKSQQLEGMHFSDFISIRIRLYFEMWMNIKKGVYTDLPDTNLVIAEQLFKELQVDLDALYVDQINDVIRCKKSMGEDVVKLITAQAENIFAAIQQLKNDEEYILRSGYDSNPFGHCLYISVRRIGNNFITRVDNRGDGYENHEITSSTTSTTSTPSPNNNGSSNVSKKITPYIVGVFSLNDLQNLSTQQKIISYLKGVIEAPLGDTKQQAFKKIYQKINQTTLSSDVKFPEKKIQVIGNCTMRSHNGGVETRLNNLKLYKFVRQEEAGLISKIGKTLKKNNSTIITATATTTSFNINSSLLSSPSPSLIPNPILLSTTSNFFTTPTHEKLMKNFQKKLEVTWEDVYSKSAVEETLLAMAGIKDSDQNNACYRRDKKSKSGDTYFELNLTVQQSKEFLKYYQEKYPSLIITWKYNEEKQRLWVLMNTIVLFNDVAPALGSYKKSCQQNQSQQSLQEAQQSIQNTQQSLRVNQQPIQSSQQSIQAVQQPIQSSQQPLQNTGGCIIC